MAGRPAPYLDYRAPTDDENSLLGNLTSLPWQRDGLEQKALEHAALHLVPQHLDEVRHRKEELVDKTVAAVNDRRPFQREPDFNVTSVNYDLKKLLDGSSPPA